MLWSGISQCAWLFLFVYFVSQCLHSWSIPTLAWFLFRNILWRLVSVLFWLLYIPCSIIVVNYNSFWKLFWCTCSFFVMCRCPRTCGWCVILAHAPTNGVQQLVHSAPLIEKRWSYVAVTLKAKFKMLPPENFLATGDCFECNTYHITALGWLKKEDDEQFWFSTISGLPL